MLNAKRNRNIFIDIFKYFLAFLVINLHCGDATYRVYSNLAVPAFFMMSGYFLYKKGQSPSEERDYAFNYLIRAITYCLGAFFIEIIAEMTFLRLVWNDNVTDYFYSLYKFNLLTDVLLLNHPIFKFGYHLWFLMALLDIGIVHYLLVRFNKTHWYVWIAPALLVLSYYVGPIATKMFDGNALTESYRNGLLWGVPYAGMGYYMAKYRNKEEHFLIKYAYLAVGIAAFFAIKYEAITADPYLSVTVCSYCLIRFFSSLEGPQCKYFYKYVGTQGSLYIYIVHIMVFNMYLFSNVLTWGRKALWITFFTSFGLYEAAHLFVMLLRFVKTGKYKKLFVKKRSA